MNRAGFGRGASAAIRVETVWPSFEVGRAGRLQAPETSLNDHAA